VVKLNPITNKITEIVEEDVEHNQTNNVTQQSHNTSGKGNNTTNSAPLGFKRGANVSREGKEHTADNIKKKNKKSGDGSYVLNPSTTLKSPGKKGRPESRFDEVSSVFYRTHL
jgi:hypothetical protein